MNVLCVDGPKRGELYDPGPNSGSRFAYLPAPSFDLADPDKPVTLDQRFYHVHRFAIGHTLLSLASIHPDPDDIAEADLLSVILSEPAQRAIQP